MIEMSIGSLQAEPWLYMVFVSKPLTLIWDAVNDWLIFWKRTAAYFGKRTTEKDGSNTEKT